MKYFLVALVVTIFCATNVLAAPSPPPTTNELTLFEDESFDIIDIVTKLLNSMIEKAKCTLDVIGNHIGKGELKNVYKKFRADVEAIFNNDVKQCMQAKGDIEKLKCALTVNQKLNTLYGNFIREVIKTETNIAKKLVKALYQCAKKESPTEKSFELAVENELTLLEDESFDIIDIVTKLLNSMIEKAKCTLDVIGDLIGKGELRNVYKKFRADVEAIFNNDVKKCMQTKGVLEKFKCALIVNQKLNTLYGNFIIEVIKTKTNIAEKLVKALYQCAKKESPTENPFELAVENELTLFDEEESFGVIDIVTQVLNNIIEKAKCTLDVIDKLIGAGELRGVYRKFRKDVEAILMNDVKKCMETKGVLEKIKCALTVNQKLNTLYANFIKQLLKTHTNIGMKLVKALFECAMKEAPKSSQEPFEEIYELSTLDDELMFDAVDVIEKILNYIKCFVDAISKAVNDTDLAPVWEATKKDIDAILKRLKACKNGENKVDEIRCTIKEIQGVVPIIKNFIKSLKKAHQEVHDRIRKNVQKCKKF